MLYEVITAQLALLLDCGLVTTIQLSFVGVALAATYPFMKRFHYLPQVHLGAAFGWAVITSYSIHYTKLYELRLSPTLLADGVLDEAVSYNFV